MEQSKQQS